MKKILSTAAVVILFVFAFAIFSDAFFCQEGKPEASRSQVPVHCCVQCCPSHNVAPTPGQILVLDGPVQSESFILENLTIQERLLISRIDRPPIA